MARIIELPVAAPEERTAPAQREPDSPVGWTDAVYVLFTSADETLAALRVAKDLARGLGSTVRVVHLRAVPFGAPVEAPTGRSPAEADAFLDRAGADDVDVRVRVYVCRDTRRAIPLVFGRHSLIVIGGRHRWWPTQSGRWRRRLEAEGHFVVGVDDEATRLA